MPTTQQQLGNLGEKLIASSISCPRCKRGERTLRTMPPNFRCADIVCDFCGFLAQVKSTTVTPGALDYPSKILGAAWGPQKSRMDAGIYFSLYVVAVAKDNPKSYAIYFLPAELQTPQMFVPRKPLSVAAKRAGWQGYVIDLDQALGGIIRIA